ncbi:MAG: GNAT family N-acetyltransferase [Candidatus Melainabacteria bacterium]|nr:GNAT family N-acetyltransferase [Candidatus Melainabacteria bacterium]MBI3308667.1 GNAT family N-acetyltransferase [Candidatus Melainabacteria bacterium]
MLKSLAIIQFDSKYAGQVADLILGIQRNEFDVEITLNEQPDLLDINEFYIKSGGNFLIALDNDIVIGTIAVLNISDGLYALRKMFVDFGYRGKENGVAKILLDRLFAWLKDKNAKEVYLGTISKYKAAHRFYEKNDFIEVKKENLPETFPLMKVDDRFFKYSFVQSK